MARYGYGMSVSGSRKSIVASSGGAAPSGIAYADASAVAISVINFTLFKENTFEDGNLTYQFDEGTNTPTNYYAYSQWNYDTGTGDRAILAFNTSATTYYSNQPASAPNVSLSPNTWYLIKFEGGNPDEGSTPPVPSLIAVNTSSSQSANSVPRALWSPNITITAA